MSSQWRILDFMNFQGSISHVRGNLRVFPKEYKADEESMLPFMEKLYYDVPLIDISLILLGDKCTFSSGTLNYIARYDVVVLVCNWKNVPESMCIGLPQHSRIAARHIAQASLPVPKKKQAWATIVRSKILGQAANLSEVCARIEAEKLVELAKNIRSGDADNKEAQAAKIYWRALFKDKNFRRDTEREDSYNAALNYAYTVLRGHGIRAVLGAGLNPALGLFHKSYCNNFNLVDDIIEPFRPAIDYAIREIAPQELCPETRKSLVATCTRKFLPNGIDLVNALEDFAQHLGKYYENPTIKLHCPEWKVA